MSLQKSDVKLKVDFCSYKAAKYACKHWHYTGNAPMGKGCYVGIWLDGVFDGCLLFRNGANNNMSKPYGLTQWECIELARVAINHNHPYPVTQVMASAIKILKKHSPGLRLLVSYADTMQGHHGGIYQGCNWIYTGQTNGDTEYYIDGRWRKARNFRSSEWSKYSNIDYKKLPSRKTIGKHRYLYPLDRKMRRQIEPLALPYPKKPADD